MGNGNFLATADVVRAQCVKHFANWQLPDDVMFVHSRPQNCTRTMNKKAGWERLKSNGSTNERTMKHSTLILVILVVAVLALTSPGYAQKVVTPRAGASGSWQVIGTLEVNFTADHDTLVVRGPFDDFRRIKFKVTNAGLNLQRMVVVYENGEPEQITVRSNIPKGGESRQIDLAGAGKRRIRRIDFWYDTKGLLNGKAHVTVFGMK